MAVTPNPKKGPKRFAAPERRNTFSGANNRISSVDDAIGVLASAFPDNSDEWFPIARKIDKNNDGSVSHYELHRAFSDLGVALPGNMLQVLFQCFDKDRSGSIDYRELFQQVAEHKRRSLGLTFMFDMPRFPTEDQFLELLHAGCIYGSPHGKHCQRIWTALWAAASVHQSCCTSTALFNAPIDPVQCLAYCKRGVRGLMQPQCSVCLRTLVPNVQATTTLCGSKCRTTRPRGSSQSREK